MKESKNVKTAVKTAVKEDRIRVTKAELTAALDDISTIFDFDDMPDVAEASIRELVDFIEKKQKSKDDRFSADDFEIKGGKAIGLSAETVKTLIACRITVPEAWKEELKKITPEKPAPKAKDEYQKAIDEAREEKYVPATEAEAREEKYVPATEAEEPEEEAEEEDAPKTEKPQKKEKTAKPVIKNDKGTKKGSGGTKIKALLEFATPLFEKGIAEEELYKKLAEKFPETAAATFKTQVYRCRNAKYNVLPKLVVKSADGILKFQK